MGYKVRQLNEKDYSSQRKRPEEFFGHLAISRPEAGYGKDKPGTSFISYQIA